MSNELKSPEKKINGYVNKTNEGREKRMNLVQSKHLYEAQMEFSDQKYNGNFKLIWIYFPKDY